MQLEAIEILKNSKVPLDLKLEFKRKYYFLFLDQLLRIIYLYLYLEYNLSSWLFIIINLVVFGIEVVYFEFLSHKLTKKYRQFLNKEYDISKIKISEEIFIGGPLGIFVFIYGFSFSYWFQYHVAANHSWYMHILFFLGALVGAMIFIILVIMLNPRTIKSKLVDYTVTSNEEGKVIYVTKYFPDILLNLDIEIKPENIHLDSIDFNDTQIAKLESDLKGTNSKVEAYLLESVLLGGLAFSGFLTVVSGTILNQTSTEFDNLRNDFYNFCENLVAIKNYSDFENLYNIFHRHDLFVAIMFLCLFSSVFFLLVLTLRMRYMGLSLEMDHLIRIMSVFNAKEEELTNIKFDAGVSFHKNQEVRLGKITKKIDFAISDANKLMKKLKPVVTMMSTCRNFAVFIFYLVLIVSGLYFSPFIAFTILMTAVLVVLVRWIETITKIRSVKELLSRHK